MFFVFFFKQKTAYEMRISDWSSDVCSSDLWNLHNAHVDVVESGEGSLELERGVVRVVPEGEQQVNRDATECCLPQGIVNRTPVLGARLEIGRATCRERVCQYV